jgi:hypothetical protein
MPANASRGEVELPFGDGALTLRCSYGAIGEMLPILFDAPEDVRNKRREWLGATLSQFGVDPPPLERMEWHHHLLGAAASQEVATVAAVIAILAHEKHPELTVEQVMAESPPMGVVWTAFDALARLYHWRPGQEPEVQRLDVDRPFDQSWLSSMLSMLLRRPGSSPNGSGE